jgi:hypothetical protein
MGGMISIFVERKTRRVFFIFKGPTDSLEKPVRNCLSLIRVVRIPIAYSLMRMAIKTKIYLFVVEGVSFPPIQQL